jgi:hypothetical protein
MHSVSFSNAKSSQDYTPQGFAAYATSNLSSVAINAGQQARNVATSVSGRITPPNTCSGIALKAYQAIVNAGNQKPAQSDKNSSSVRVQTPPEVSKQSPITMVEKQQPSFHRSPNHFLMVDERKPSPL